MAGLPPAIAAAQPTISVALPCESDTLLASAHKMNNFGAGELSVKVGNGVNRMLLKCDLTPLAGRADDVVSAILRLRLESENFTTDGTLLSIHANQGPAWQEGAGRFEALNYCNRPEYRRPAKKASGAGVTWNCAVDGNVSDTKSTPCTGPWAGGFPGFSNLPTQTITQYPRPADNTCEQALSCYAGGGGVDCWRTLEFDVSPDVRAAVDSGTLVGDWLIKRTTEQGRGAFEAFSREQAVCILGIPELRPLLIVSLVEQPGDPPIVPDPMLDGLGYPGDRCAYVNP